VTFAPQDKRSYAIHTYDATQLNSTVVTVGDNAMTSSALWRHKQRVVC